MKTLNAAAKAFLSHCKYEKNLNFKTLKAYSLDLNQLLNFLKQNHHNVEFANITKSTLRNYVQSLSGFKPKTVKRKIASSKALFNFLEFEDLISVSPFRKMKLKIKEPKNLPNVMDIHEVGRIIKTSYQSLDRTTPEKFAYRVSLRNIAVIELLFATGIRVSELSHLKNSHVDLQFGHIKVQGQGNKERMIQVCNSEALNALRNYHRAFSDKVSDTNGFFLSIG
jgi:integrase/recombinase XerD